MGEDEGAVKIDRFLVVLGRVLPFAMNEMELGTMVVNIGVIFILLDRAFDIRRGLCPVTWSPGGLAFVETTGEQGCISYPFPSACSHV